ncbi:hypothetical protein ACQCWA_22505 [Rossellomorea aquimaris]|uniref:hypothetical protein n=1 Tax=Bacillaceae TaxID=186817 RepID=UPI0011EDF0E6|nr:hypothetical protein [Bacillus sp. CH30_1T]KAA0564627.1 hypothetical protein F0342_10785 [Bacillus sp. CH30_1T]
MKKSNVLVKVVGGLLIVWALFQAFYLSVYGQETEFSYFVNIAGPALFSLFILTLAIKKIVEKDVKMFSLYLILSVAVAYVSSAYVL